MNFSIESNRMLRENTGKSKKSPQEKFIIISTKIDSKETGKLRERESLERERERLPLTESVGRAVEVPELLDLANQLPKRRRRFHFLAGNSPKRTPELRRSRRLTPPSPASSLPPSESLSPPSFYRGTPTSPPLSLPRQQLY